jgi:hypothetical protein
MTSADTPEFGSGGGGDGGGDGGGGGAGPLALASDPDYPVTAGLDASMDIARWRVIGNYIMGIPHLVWLYILNAVAGLVVFVAWFVVLFTGRLPEGMGTFVAGVHRYQWRVFTFVMFLRQPYPAFGLPSGYAEPGGDPAWLQISQPGEFSRLNVLFRIILAIPQFLFGIVLGIGLWVAMIVGFFAVLITGRWPEGLRRFVAGVMFWGIRVNAWYTLLTDTYPPFTLG